MLAQVIQTEPDREASAQSGNGFSPDLKARVKATTLPALAQIATAYRQAQPTPDSSSDLVVLRSFVQLILQSAQELGASAPALFGWLADVGFRELANLEAQKSGSGWKLALRNLDKALETIDLFFEFYQLLLEQERVALDDLFLKLDASDLEQALASQRGRSILRWLLECLTALDVLAPDVPLEEFSYWAFRAVAGARKAKAWLLSNPTFGLTGELARLRARHAWDNWDDEEIAEEVRPWRTP